MKSLQSLLRDLFEDLRELEDDEFIKKSRSLLDGKPRSLVLAAIFLEFQNSLSGALLMNLAFWFEKIEYQDILQAMLELGNKGLPSYHFASYVPDIFGVDVRKAALDIQKKHAADREKVSYFANLKQLIGPSKHTIEKLEEFGASPAKIRESLLKTGAPLLPLPENLELH